MINFLRLVVMTWLTWVELCADADIRNNVFMTDKNCMQARIADKAADVGLKQIILITVFYSLEERLCMTIPKKLVLTIFFSQKLYALLVIQVYV